MLSNFPLQFSIGLSQSLLGLFACGNIPLHHQRGRTSFVFDAARLDLDHHPMPLEGDDSQFILLRHGLAPHTPLIILLDARPVLWSHKVEKTPASSGPRVFGGVLEHFFKRWI